MTAFQERLEAKSAEATLADQNVSALRLLGQKLTDLEFHTDRWKRERAMSSSVNSIASDVDIIHNCGCCSDSPLEAWPYVLMEGRKVFSKPPSFVVGEKNAFGSGERPGNNWEEPLRQALITPVVIERIREYLAANPPEDCEDSPE